MDERYDVLDGLRGTAALLVVTLHLCATFWPDAASNPLHHGYLAVDFFFMLSGFVIGHAYDRRWARMGARAFFARRLVRLHPLVLLGAGLGLASYLVTDVGMQGAALWPRRVAENVVLASLLLPAPGPPGLLGMTHALNPPSWSLTQEYLANIAYAAVGPRIAPRALKALVAACAAGLVALALANGSVDVGWGWSNLWLGPVRTAFPFFAGLLLQRAGLRLAGRLGWAALSLVLAAAFAAPVLPKAGPVQLNGAFDALLVVGVFPLVIALGAAARPRGRMARLCRLSGEISYPIYMVHAPIVHVYAGWVHSHHPPHRLALAMGGALGLILPFVAWASLKLYDEPVRALLARGLQARGKAGRRASVESRAG